MEDARAEAASAVMRRHAQRVRLAAARPANWMELMRYCCVGGSGYLINLGVFVLSPTTGRVIGSDITPPGSSTSVTAPFGRHVRVIRENSSSKIAQERTKAR